MEETNIPNSYMSNLLFYRTTFLIGAGTPLDLVLPQDVIKPSTTEITNDVRRVYTDYLTQDDTINIVDDIYNWLMKNYPPDRSNPYVGGTPTPYIHFEHLFWLLYFLGFLVLSIALSIVFLTLLFLLLFLPHFALFPVTALQRLKFELT